jgi:hypothetical protein
MKEVKFDLVLKVHDKLEEEDLKKYLEIYAINNNSVRNITQKVIGEVDSPNNFYIDSMELKEKKKVKKTKTKSVAKKKTAGKSWDVV